MQSLKRCASICMQYIATRLWNAAWLWCIAQCNWRHAYVPVMSLVLSKFCIPAGIQFPYTLSYIARCLSWTVRASCGWAFNVLKTMTAYISMCKMSLQFHKKTALCCVAAKYHDPRLSLFSKEWFSVRHCFCKIVLELRHCNCTAFVLCLVIAHTQQNNCAWSVECLKLSTSSIIIVMVIRIFFGLLWNGSAGHALAQFKVLALALHDIACHRWTMLYHTKLPKILTSMCYLRLHLRAK